MKNAIYEIFLNISCSLDDRYILSKIIYFENYISYKNIKQDTLIFNKIIDWKKNDKLNFKEFFESLPITDPDNDKLFDDYKDFIKYLKNNYEIEINIDEENYCKFDYFIEIINKIDSELCPKIYDYRKTFINMMNVMLNASEKIISLSNNKSKLIRNNLPTYLKNLHIHIPNWKNKELIKNIIDTASKKIYK